ncbi:MAG TPA: hypothetical protein PLX97_10950 [Gemmatales bacterium]|nr:hypothetical protein [Gemmatales bacterium]
MTASELKCLKTLPSSSSLVVQALWHDARGDWEAAHQCAQEDHSSLGSWMHAYLHRKEGDMGNARYWYSQAGRKVFAGTLEEEWQALAEEVTSSLP